MVKRTSIHQFLICVKNDAYPASLELRKLYRTLPDPAASKKGFVRVVDESGDNSLYPANCFVSVDLPKAAVDALLATSEKGRTA